MVVFVNCCFYETLIVLKLVQNLNSKYQSILEIFILLKTQSDRLKSKDF